jgi:hypothetical protein
MSEVLVQTLQSIRIDLATLHTDVCSARSEASAQHLAINRQFGGLSEMLININERVAKLENRKPPASGLRTAVSGVGEIARAAILG